MEKFYEILEWLETSKALIVLAGAGMGVDSGLADYRGDSGQWGQVEEDTNLSALDVANPKFLSENPKYVWKMLAQKMFEYKNTQPHLGFSILKNWISDFNLDYFIITSNVDEQFTKAGFNEQKIRELHGNIFYMQCNKPCNNKIWRYSFDIGEILSKIENGDYPRCSNCGDLIRPNVYMFRDYSYISHRSDEQEKRFQSFLEKYKDDKILIFEIGSGPHVQSIRKKTRMLGIKYNTKIVRINPKDFRIKEPHIGIAKRALEALTEIDEFIKNTRV